MLKNLNKIVSSYLLQIIPTGVKGFYWTFSSSDFGHFFLGNVTGTSMLIIRRIFWLEQKYLVGKSGLSKIRKLDFSLLLSSRSRWPLMMRDRNQSQSQTSTCWFQKFIQNISPYIQLLYIYVHKKGGLLPIVLWKKVIGH